MKRIFVLVVGLMVSGLAWSESWVGLNYATLEQDNRFYRGQSERLETDEVFFRLGADMNDYFASELRLGTTLGAIEEFGYTFEHDYILTALFRARYEMGVFSPYLALGPSRVEESVTSPTGGSASANVNGVAGGLGVDIELGDHFGINAEYMRYYDIGDVMLRGPSAGLFWRF